MAHTIAGEYKVSTILGNIVDSGRECPRKRVRPVFKSTLSNFSVAFLFIFFSLETVSDFCEAK